MEAVAKPDTDGTGLAAQDDETIPPRERPQCPVIGSPDVGSPGRVVGPEQPAITNDVGGGARVEKNRIARESSQGKIGHARTAVVGKGPVVQHIAGLARLGSNGGNGGSGRDLQRGLEVGRPGGGGGTLSIAHYHPCRFLTLGTPARLPAVFLLVRFAPAVRAACVARSPLVSSS